ncbi:MAG: hypothetical protein IJP62_08275 [Treponema sp.]|nr:hypothetical protein [Treponema sp.]
MILNIAKGYKKLFDSAIKGILLLVACAVLGAAIVWPLWKFATAAPNVYTMTMLILIGAVLLIWLAKYVKKVGAKYATLKLGKIMIIAAGLCGSIVLVLNGKRFFAIPVLLVMIALYGVISFGPEREKK